MFNFKLSKLDPLEINEKLKEVFEKLNCAAKVKLALEFILRNVDRDESILLRSREQNFLREIAPTLFQR